MLFTKKIRDIRLKDVLLYSLYLLAFSISLYKKIIPFVILIYLMCWIYYFISERRRIIVKFNIIRFLAMVLFTIYAFSMFYTTDLFKGQFDLEVKLSLLVFPLLMSFSDNFSLTKKQFREVLNFYTYGVFLTTIICFCIALYRGFTIFFTDDFFTYTYLASFHHPTYLAMFVNIAITVLMVNLLDAWIRYGNYKRFSIILLILYFIIFVFLLNSKAGILVMFLNIIGIIFMYTFYKRRITVMILLLSFFLLISFILVKKVSFVNERFNDMVYSLKNIKNINPATENDSEQRILIWKYSYDIISNHWITGVGAGDVSASLSKKYIENGFVSGIKKKLNCHNQFLQTFVATGIIGFMVLILLLFFILFSSVKKRNVIGVSFFIIVAGNMLTESILEVQAGTVFMGFFLAFLFNNYSD